MSDATTWIEDPYRPTTAKVRDEGATAKDAEKDEATGVTRPATPARNAWPQGTYVRLRETISGASWRKIQRLQMQKNPTVKANDQDGMEMEAELDVSLTPAAIYCAVLLEGLICPVGGVFTDPTTCERDEDGAPKLETGQILSWPKPDDLEARVEAAQRLPVQVQSYVHAEVTEKLISPLPGTTILATGTSTKGASGRR